MPNQRTTIAAIAFLAMLLIPAVAVIFSGCSTLRSWDKALQPAPGVPAPGTPGPGPPQPPGEEARTPAILELAAAILGMLGFGGMATWIRRVRIQGNGKIADLQKRLDQVEIKQLSLADPSPN